MADQVDKLPAGFSYADDETDDGLPPGFKYVEERSPQEKYMNEFAAQINQQMRDLGIDPEPGEQAEQYGMSGGWNLTKALLNGATAGISTNIPGLSVEEGPEAILGEAVGAAMPISKLLSWTGKGAAWLAAKSPILQRQITSGLRLLGVGASGATYKGFKHLAEEHELPTGEDLLLEGTEWMALDLGLNLIGGIYKFGKALAGIGEKTGTESKKVLNEVINQLKSEGAEFDQPTSVAGRALELIEEMTQNAERIPQGRQLKVEPGEFKPKEKPQTGLTIEPEQISSTDLKTKKISVNPVNNLRSSVSAESQAFLPENTDMTKAARNLENTALTFEIEKSGERAANDLELGNAIREDIESGLNKAKKEYGPLYKEAEDAAHTIEHNPAEAVKEAESALRKLDRNMKTKPGEYASTIKQLETILEDLGFVVEREGKNGPIVAITPGKNVFVSDSIELARRINHIIDFETIDPAVKNILKPVNKALKADIRSGLKANEDALTAFNLAEEAHATTSKKYGRDSIYKIRKTEAGEKVASQAKAATTMQDLKEVLSPKQMAQVERETLEKLNNMNYEQSKKHLREINKQLSEKNQKLAEKIVESKNPHNPRVRNNLIKEGILDEMSKSLSTGQRPNKTLELWKTKQGQKLIKETFQDTPNWKEIKGYLEDQSLADLTKSILNKDGKLDTAKLKDFMKDPAVVDNIYMLGGENAVDFFANLEHLTKELDKNIKLLERIPVESDLKRGKELLKRTAEKSKPSKPQKPLGAETLKIGEKVDKEAKAAATHRGNKILERMSTSQFPHQMKFKKWEQWFKETMDLSPQAALSVFSIMKLGIPNAVASVLGVKMMRKLATNPRVRKAFMKMAEEHLDPVSFIVAVEGFANAVDED